MRRIPGPLPGRRSVPQPHRRTSPAVALARLATVMADGWEHLSECVIRGLDPDLFFPDFGEPVDPRVFGACGACQVRFQCLQRAMRIERDATETKQRHGIWGGLMPRQRTALAAGRKVRLIAPTRDRNRYKRAKAAREAPGVFDMRVSRPGAGSRRSG